MTSDRSGRYSKRKKMEEPVEIDSNSSDYSIFESEIEIWALREALANQKKKTEELMIELEQERAASATSATEAMSMILRLQREKAEILMESRQFKRFAEGKMRHDQQELMFLEDLICAREMDLEKLKFEVQSIGKGLNRRVSFHDLDRRIQYLEHDFGQKKEEFLVGFDGDEEINARKYKGEFNFEEDSKRRVSFHDFERKKKKEYLVGFDGDEEINARKNKGEVDFEKDLNRRVSFHDLDRRIQFLEHDKNMVGLNSGQKKEEFLVGFDGDEEINAREYRVELNFEDQSTEDSLSRRVSFHDLERRKKELSVDFDGDEEFNARKYKGELNFGGGLNRRASFHDSERRKKEEFLGGFDWDEEINDRKDKGELNFEVQRIEDSLSRRVSFHDLGRIIQFLEQDFGQKKAEFLVDLDGHEEINARTNKSELSLQKVSTVEEDSSHRTSFHDPEKRIQHLEHDSKEDFFAGFDVDNENNARQFKSELSLQNINSIEEGANRRVSFHDLERTQHLERDKNVAELNRGQKKEVLMGFDEDEEISSREYTEVIDIEEDSNRRVSYHELEKRIQRLELDKNVVGSNKVHQKEETITNFDQSSKDRRYQPSKFSCEVEENNEEKNRRASFHDSNRRIHKLEHETEVVGSCSKDQKVEFLTGFDGDEEIKVDRVYTVDTVKVSEDYSNREERDIQRLYARLQALEADRESMKQAIMLFQTEKTDVLLKEIAQQMYREAPVKKVVVKKESFLGRFSFVAAIKWVVSFVFRWKPEKETRYRFDEGRLGLLLILENSSLWRQQWHRVLPRLRSK